MTPFGTEKPCSGYGEDDIAESGQDMTDVAAVPPVGGFIAVGRREMERDLLLHPVLEDLADGRFERLPGSRRPIRPQTSDSFPLDHFHASGRFLIHNLPFHRYLLLLENWSFFLRKVPDLLPLTQEMIH